VLTRSEQNVRIDMFHLAFWILPEWLSSTLLRIFPASSSSAFHILGLCNPVQVFEVSFQRHIVGNRQNLTVSFLYISRISPSGLYRLRITFWNYLKLPSENLKMKLKSFRHFRRSPWLGDRPYAMPVPSQENTNTEKRGHTSCLEWDSKPLGHWYWPQYTVWFLDTLTIQLCPKSETWYCF